MITLYLYFQLKYLFLLITITITLYKNCRRLAQLIESISAE